MDQAFVEQVTRMVLAKLEQVLSAELRADLPAASSGHASLTPQEVERWNAISQKVNVFRSDCSAVAEVSAACRPLTQDELKRWEEIAFSLNKAKSKADKCAAGTNCSAGGGLIKIYQYG